MVPSTGCIFIADLHHHPRLRSLCQVCHFIFPRYLHANQGSFFNVERTQIRKVTAVQIHYTEAGGITGHMMLLCMLLMYTTAHHKIRQQSFETFWYTHHLFIPFLLGLYTHATGCFVRDTVQPFSPFDSKNFWTHCIGYEGWRWELWGGGLYFMERVYREIRARKETKIVRVVRHPYGQYIMILMISQD
jgi:NADPH oxidase